VAEIECQAAITNLVALHDYLARLPFKSPLKLWECPGDAYEEISGRCIAGVVTTGSGRLQAGTTSGAHKVPVVYRIGGVNVYSREVLSDADILDLKLRM
jgi:hypothetical protein